VSLVSIFAAQAQNPHWQWYVDAHGNRRPQRGYVGFIRGALGNPEPKSPEDLPSSRLFAGVGQAMLNSNLADANDNVQIIFKSSPFGTQSHGYESQNSFLIYAFGERLFIRTGRRDSYGSDHHKNWMWETRSVNNITVNGKGQGKRLASAVGKIVNFETTEHFDWVVGEAGEAYDEDVGRFTRAILFVKPDVIVMHDILEVSEPSTFEWRLHTSDAMEVNGQEYIRAVKGDASGKVSLLWPKDLVVSQTDKFDVPPRPRIKLVEHHLTAATPEKLERQEFVTVFRIHRTGEVLEGEARLEHRENGFKVRVPIQDGEAVVNLIASKEVNDVQASVQTEEGRIVREFTEVYVKE
jgi:hypothetical protein